MVTSTGDTPGYYEILGLPRPSSSRQPLSSQQLKAAYRTTLLKYHPDKSLNSSAPGLEVTARNGQVPYTVDQISKAYAVLSVPKLRFEYDHHLNLQNWAGGADQQRGEIFQAGSETLDLEDLAYDEAKSIWYKSCRCGDPMGFVVRETDLQEFSDKCEIHVGCKGCSLWLRILFEVIEENPTQQVPEGMKDELMN
jgi:diphthamide biosynthesis protein 4